MLSRKNDYISWAPVVLLLGVAVFFRMLNINKSFSGDETILIGMSGQDLCRIIPSLLKTDVYPPLTYILVHYFMKISSAVFFIRLYFVIFGIGCCVLIYALAKELMGKKGAFIALGLATASPLLIFASQYARSYIDSAFWMLFSSLFMLKIIKGDDRLPNWIGYVLTSAAGLYTFYFSTLLLVTQVLFITIFKWGRGKVLAKWYFSFSAIALIFFPWAGTAIRQLHNASSLIYDWSGKGLNLGGLRLGMYARNLAAMLGFDPYFMVYAEGIHKHYPKAVLVMTAAALITAFILLFRYYIRMIGREYPGRRDLSWFIPSLAIGPVVLSWTIAGALNTLPNGKYLVAFHAIFLIMVAAVIYNLLKKRPFMGMLLLGCIAAIFILRLPQAVSPEFDSAAAYKFAKNNIIAGEPLICVRSLPEGPGKFNIVSMGSYLVMGGNGSRYMPISASIWDEPAKRIAPYKRIWFYRVYGNAEIFGANSMVEAWLLENGFQRVKVNKFKNIDIEEYEKK